MSYDIIKQIERNLPNFQFLNNPSLSMYEGVGGTGGKTVDEVCENVWMIEGDTPHCRSDDTGEVFWDSLINSEDSYIFDLLCEPNEITIFIFREKNAVRRSDRLREKRLQQVPPKFACYYEN